VPHTHTEPDAGDPDPSGDNTLTLELGEREIVLRQRFELVSLANEIGIALFFTVGSVFFYFESLYVAGVTLFVIGSVQLGIRPAIRFARRVSLRRVTKGMPHEVARDF
jgi:hypothetical protein